MIGENIQRIRRSKGMTLSELAERAAISKSYLSNIERNLNQNPSIQIIERIADVLEVDFQTLIGMRNVKKDFPEEEWLQFAKELRDSGIGVDQLKNYQSIIEFVKWQNRERNRNK